MLLTGLPAALGRIAEIRQTLADLAVPVIDTAAPETTRTDFAGTLAEARQTSSPTSTQRAAVSPTPDRFASIIKQAAARYGVDEDLVHAVVQAESNYDPDCHSSAGALGLMQLMPATARALGVDPRDPARNVDGGVRYLRQQLDRFGEVDLALAAYNAGPGAVQRHHGVPPYRETQAYVKRVLQTLWQRKGE